MKRIQDKTDVVHPVDDSKVPATRDPSNPFVVVGSRLLRRTIRRQELHRMVPLADTTIYDMERRGEFPRRFNITARCVVWDAAEVEAWLEARRHASDTAQPKRAPSPDVRQRKRRPVKAMLAS
jgi:prophage regulatory protein